MVEISDQPIAQQAMAEALFKSELKENENIEKYVTGGIWGITLLGSDMSGEYIDLTARYRIGFPIGLFQVKGIWVSQESKNKKWTGRPIVIDEKEGLVYITEYGNAYHRSKDCHYLSLSIQETNIAEIQRFRNNSEHKYYACELCAEEITDNETVYLTPYGTAYHADLSCAGLKRTIYLVKLSEVGGRHPCGKCYGNGGK